jgi:ribosomal-protein-alanine N-acetyltransferase
MNLRAATGDDLDVLATLHGLAFQPGWDAEEIADVGSGPGAFALIAEDAGPLDHDVIDPSGLERDWREKPVPTFSHPALGMILCRALAGEAEILTLAVDPAARRRGVARALVEAAAALAREAGAMEMFLEVATDNPAALGLYAGTGFATVGQRRGYYSRPAGERVDAVVMRRDLNTGPVSSYS